MQNIVSDEELLERLANKKKEIAEMVERGADHAKILSATEDVNELMKALGVSLNDW